MQDSNTSIDTSVNPKPKQYSLEKPDTVSKTLVLNIFRRGLSSNSKPQKLFNFLEKLYYTSTRLGFLSLHLYFLKSKKIKKLSETLKLLENRILQTYLSDLITAIQKHGEILETSRKLEKLLRSKQQKKLQNTKSDHLPEFAFNIMKRIISSVVYRYLFSSFTLMKLMQRSKFLQSPNKFKRFLCFSIKGVAIRQMNSVLRTVFIYNDERKLTNKRLTKLFSVFLNTLGKIWVVLKYFEKTPKYFLSAQWKHSSLNKNLSIKTWKKTASSALFTIISKKIICLECFAFCRLTNGCSSFWSQTISPIKFSNLSTDDSNVSIFLKKIRLQDILSPVFRPSPEKIKFALLRLFEVIQTRINYQIKKVVFILRNPKVLQITPQRVSCKDLPVCRKLANTSFMSGKFVASDRKSVSPFRAFVIKKHIKRN